MAFDQIKRGDQVRTKFPHSPLNQETYEGIGTVISVFGTGLEGETYVRVSRPEGMKSSPHGVVKHIEEVTKIQV